MIPQNITKEHILKAIEEIDIGGVEKGRHSSTYDLVFKGEKYPPKLILSIANKYANGSELEAKSFPGGVGTPAFQLLEKEGFEIIRKEDPIKSLIERYKLLITKTEMKDEIYKWELLSQYGGRPDTNAVDFHQEVKGLKFKNLIYGISGAVLNHLAKDKTEALREVFKNLFDETQGLTERVKVFNKDTLKIYREVNKTHKHHQDERSIATYLTFHNSKEYTFYKSSFYKKYCKKLKIKEAKVNEKYTHYLSLIEELVESYIKPDIELINQVKRYIPDVYDSGNLKLLAQDILYQMLDNKSETDYWIFQGNPNDFDIKTALREEILTDWTVSAHKEKIKIGDKVILWITGSESGCYALAEVTAEPYEKETSPDDHLWKKESKAKLKADIKITHNLVDSPILKASMEDLKELKKLKAGNQGTNFSATEEEYKTILNLTSNTNSFTETKNKFPLTVFNNYIEFLRKIHSELRLKPNDERIVYSVLKNRLNFTVGQRYCLNLYLSGAKGTYGVISSSQLTDKSEPYEGTPKAFYSYYDDFAPNNDVWNSIIDGISNQLDKTNKSSYTRYNNTDFENYVFNIQATIRPIKKPMNFPLNQILYGPPGTGKTYNTILKAAEIISNKKIDSYDEALKIFNDNLHNRIEFITFHQNYSYEDFIQGLRPDTEDESEQLKFKKSDGVFKKIADKALENSIESEKAPEEIKKLLAFNKALEDFKDQIIETEDNFPINNTAYITEVEDDAFRYTGDRWKSYTNGLRMKFSDLQELYRNKVENRKDIKNLTSISASARGDSTYYLLVYKQILKLISLKVERTIKVAKQNYVIIIDEINRANISRVFGELITLIEPDKRHGGKVPLTAKLPSGDKFIVPSNLYIIGTMNTADKSIALLDIALRRRFEFEPMYPKYKEDGIDLKDENILKSINESIIADKGHDFQIGHSYFMDSKEDSYDFKRRMNVKVIPLLLEYFMNDSDAVHQIISKALNGTNYKLNKKSWPLRITDESN